MSPKSLRSSISRTLYSPNLSILRSTAYVHTRLYLAQYFLEWEIFPTNPVDTIKTRFMFNNFFSENRAAYEIMYKIQRIQTGHK